MGRIGWGEWKVCGKFQISLLIFIMTGVYIGCTLLSVVTCVFLVSKAGIFLQMQVLLHCCY
jgi:hypothetical protein